MKFDIEKEFEILKEKDLLAKSYFNNSLTIFKSKIGIVEYLKQHELFNKKQVATFATHAFLNRKFFTMSAQKTLKLIAHIVDPKSHRRPQWLIETYHPFVIGFIAGYIDSCDSIEDAVDLMYSKDSVEKYDYIISEVQKITKDKYQLHAFNSQIQK